MRKKGWCTNTISNLDCPYLQKKKKKRFAKNVLNIFALKPKIASNTPIEVDKWNLLFIKKLSDFQILKVTFIVDFVQSFLIKSGMPLCILLLTKCLSQHQGGPWLAAGHCFSHAFHPLWSTLLGICLGTDALFRTTKGFGGYIYFWDHRPDDFRGQARSNLQAVD